MRLIPGLTLAKVRTRAAASGSYLNDDFGYFGVSLLDE